MDADRSCSVGILVCYDARGEWSWVHEATGYGAGQVARTWRLFGTYIGESEVYSTYGYPCCRQIRNYSFFLIQENKRKTFFSSFSNTILSLIPPRGVLNIAFLRYPHGGLPRFQSLAGFLISSLSLRLSLSCNLGLPTSTTLINFSMPFLIRLLEPPVHKGGKEVEDGQDRMSL